MMALTRDEAVALCRLACERISDIAESRHSASAAELDTLEAAANKLSVEHDLDLEDVIYDGPRRS